MTAQTVEQTRENIAGYYANMLYGNHLRKHPMKIALAHQLAGITFVSPDDQSYLTTAINARLTALRQKSCEEIAVSIVKDDDGQLFIAATTVLCH